MLELTIHGTTEIIAEEHAYEAMRRFYQARLAQDRTAKLVRLTDSGRVVVDAPERSRRSPDDLSAFTAERIARQERALKKRGIALAPPVYVPGARIYEVGDGDFRVERLPLEDSAPVIDSLQILWRLIRREERREHTVKLANVKMRENGQIDWGDGPVYMEKPALKQLLQITGAFPGGSGYLTHVEPDLRAYNWRQRRSFINDRQAKLRVRRNPLTGKFSIFAVVGPTYATMDIDELSTHIAPAFENNGMRGLVLYDSASANLRIDARWPEPKVLDAASRDAFELGVRIQTNDTGKGGVYVLGVAVRTRCLGLFVLGAGKERLYFTQHQGDMSRVGPEIEDALTKVQAQFEPFARDWAQLRRLSLEDVYGKADLPTIFSMVGRMLNPGLRRSGPVIDQLLTNYDLEAGGTVADLVVAIGRLHTGAQISHYQLEGFEVQAQSLVRRLALGISHG